ncbi:glycosyltransferase family 2 protein [Brevundimonas sp.]|uniref:glycosyltransferase family 2 protein n=1 Tax=Brevundimonas sp. TaxID=1871086 RepID=UPI0037BFB62E
MTSLSVLTLVRNRQAHLDQLIEGLRRSRSAPAELVIVDMGDAPVQASAVPCPVRIARIDGASLPLAAARNRAAALASGDHLLFLDVDCIPSADLCGRMNALLDAHDAVVCPEVLYLNPEAARGGWTEIDLRKTGSSHPVRVFPASGVRTETNPGLFWSLAFGVRSETFKRIGGFDESYTGYGAEDTDLGFRIAAAELPLIFAGEAPAFHQHHEGYEPPLQHFRPLVANAVRFHARWGVWPMDGWLSAMADLGLIDWRPDEIRVLRDPTPQERSAARKPLTVPY